MSVRNQEINNGELTKKKLRLSEPSIQVDCPWLSPKIGVQFHIGTIRGRYGTLQPGFKAKRAGSYGNSRRPVANRFSAENMLEINSSRCHMKSRAISRCFCTQSSAQPNCTLEAQWGLWANSSWNAPPAPADLKPWPSVPLQTGTTATSKSRRCAIPTRPGTQKETHCVPRACPQIACMLLGPMLSLNRS